MSSAIRFKNRGEFRQWLADNSGSEGVWLVFSKQSGVKTLTAAEALEEALCFGWIDGQMRKIDIVTYEKYFAPRREKSRWSERNKALVADLEKRGLMTDDGRKKVTEAKRNGMWDAPDLMKLGDEKVSELTKLLEEHKIAYNNFIKMPLSVRKTYTRAYFDAKTDAGRAKRLAWIVGRLNKNLRPME